MQKTPAPQTVMLLGATGAVGSAVLALALADARVALVVALTRRPLAPAPKLQNIVVDFEQLPAQAPWWQVDAVICALGTTRRIAGSDARFVAIDRDMPVRAAQLAHAGGARRYALVSSLGAQARSRNLYLRTKGETEAAIGALGFSALTIVRPSLIDTERAERRPFEHVSMQLARSLRPLIPRRWRTVTPAAIAAALLEGALGGPAGTRIIESDQL
ncbi:MAG: NAD(P)H-binding protein [Pseudomonadota bacterium]